MEKQKETVSDPRARPSRSLLNAARWAAKISLACNVLLIFVAVILGALMPSGIQVKLAERLFDALTPGFDLWNVVFGGPWHSMVWLFSSLALNLIIYFGVAFIIKQVFMFWRRSLHPGDTSSRIIP